MAILWLSFMLAQSSPELSSRRWMEEQVHFLASSEERLRFIALQSDVEREVFIERFWQRRDPTPDTMVNEARHAHRRRLEASDDDFTIAGRAGRFTPRGRILQLLGPPSFRESFARPAAGLRPLELWHYTGLTVPFLPDSFYLLFFRPANGADYRLWSPVTDGVAALFTEAEPNRFLLEGDLGRLSRLDPELALAATDLASDEESVRRAAGLLASLDALPELLFERHAPAGEARVDVVAGFRRLHGTLLARVLRDDDLPEVHYALELEAGTVATLPWRTVAGRHQIRFTVIARLIEAERELDRWQDAVELDLSASERASLSRMPLSFQGRVPIVPGLFALEIAVIAEGGESLTRRAELDARPATLTQPFFARGLRITGEAVARRPFELDGRLFNVAPDPWCVSDPLLVVAQTTRSARPMDDVPTVQWKLLMRQPSKKLWEADQPLVSGSTETLFTRIPLATFATAGVGQLQVSWGPETIALDVDLSGEPGEFPTVRVLARDSLADPARRRERRSRLFERRGDVESAAAEMERAVELAPDVDLQLRLAALGIALGNYRDVVSLLSDLATRVSDEVDLHVLLAASYEGLHRWDLAASSYHRAMELSPSDARLRDAFDRARIKAEEVRD